MELLNFEKIISIRFKEENIVEKMFHEKAKQMLIRETEHVHYHLYQLEAEFQQLKENLASVGINVLAFIKQKRHEGYSARIYEELLIEINGKFYSFDFLNDCNEKLILMTPCSIKYDGEQIKEMKRKVPKALVSLVKKEREKMVKNESYKEQYESGEKQIQLCS